MQEAQVLLIFTTTDWQVYKTVAGNTHHRYNYVWCAVDCRLRATRQFIRCAFNF